MKSNEEWLAEYAESHRNPTNQRIHKVCVPLILWAVVGFLSLMRYPAQGGVFSSGAVLASAFALLFYAFLGLKPFAQMFLLLAACLGACALLEAATSHAGAVYAAVFAAAWVGQAVGHVYEGKKPSFFKDVQFLLIGPLWILKRH